MATQTYDTNAQGMTLTGAIPVRVELSGEASGRRRNEIRTQMVRPQVCKEWELATDEARWHGGEESAPKPLSIFATGILACFMTQMRTFARACDVNVRGLNAVAYMEWQLQRSGNAPYSAAPGHMQIDIELDSDSSLEAKLLLVQTASAGCPAEATLRETPHHRLLHQGSWIDCIP